MAWMILPGGEGRSTALRNLWAPCGDTGHAPANDGAVEDVEAGEQVVVPLRL